MASELHHANGQFKVGHTGMGGRPPGSRPKLSELFWRDLHAVWQEEGRTVMERLARDDPAAFAKIAAMCVLKPDETQREASAVTVVNVITGVRG